MTKNNQLETIINANVVNSGMGIGSFFKKVGIGALALVGLHGGNAQSMEYRDGHAHSPSPVEQEYFNEAKRAETLEYWLERADSGRSSLESGYSGWKGRGLSNKNTLEKASVLARDATFETYMKSILSFLPSETRDYYTRQLDEKSRDPKFADLIRTYTQNIRDGDARLKEVEIQPLYAVIYAIGSSMPKEGREYFWRATLTSAIKMKKDHRPLYGVCASLAKQGVYTEGLEVINATDEEFSKKIQSGKVWTQPTTTVAKANPEE